MEERITKDIIKASESIRKKYRLLKRGLVEEEETRRKQFEPLLKPLETLIDLTEERENPSAEKKIKITDAGVNTDIKKRGRAREKSPNLTGLVEHVYESPGEASKAWDEWNSTLSRYGPLASHYLTSFLLDSHDSFDTTFGVRASERGTSWSIGNKHIEFAKDDSVHVGSNMFSGTKGLYELLFKKFPIKDEIKETDKRAYKQILELSSAHKQGYFPNARIASSGGHKYTQFISPLFKKSMATIQDPNEDELVSEDEGTSFGGGGYLPVTRNKIDYIYWNDPNELVARLYLLKSAEEAGNNGLSGEIASIEEELREEGII